MEKYITKTFLTIIVATLLCLSCNNEFLERYPLDELSSQTFWNTEDDLIVYNNSLYHLACNDNNVPIMMGPHNGHSDLYGYVFLDHFSDNLAPFAGGSHTPYHNVRAGKQR